MRGAAVLEETAGGIASAFESTSVPLGGRVRHSGSGLWALTKNTVAMFVSSEIISCARVAHGDRIAAVTPERGVGV